MINKSHTRLTKLFRRNHDAFPTRHADVRLLTGLAATAIAVLTIAEFIIKLIIGTRPALDNQAALVAFIAHHSTLTIVVITIDTVLMMCLIIFFAGFRQLTIHIRRELSWITDLAFGAGLVFVAVTLVGDAMDAGAALDTVRSIADPSVIRALTEGHMLMFGSIGCVFTALITATFAYTTFKSDVVPRWTGWVAYSVAVLNIAAVPTAFAGTSPTSFISAGGSGVALLATFPFLFWVVAVGIVTLRSR